MATAGIKLRGPGVVAAATQNPSVLRVELTRGYSMLLDAADWPLISGCRLYAAVRRGRPYATYYPEGDYSAIGLVHRLLVDCPAGYLVDHINGDSLDNRRANLRVCTNAENCRTKGLSRANTSGFKGVSFSRVKVHRRWVATIRVNGAQKFLGSHETPEEAARAYDRAAVAHFGEFARLNFATESP
jgi:hypothetical protein